MNTFIIIFSAAFLISFLMVPVAIKLAPKIGAMDIPKDDRRMHTKPIPRFGGFAIYLGTIGAILLNIDISLDPKLYGILVSATIMFLMGIVDDIRGLSAIFKFVVQIICAVILYMFTVRIMFIANPFEGGGYYTFHWTISLFITVVWIVGITNTINLVDGLDGLAGGIAFIASITLAYIAFTQGRFPISFIMLAIAGSTLGFLPYNFRNAKIFMGDGGSLFLGFMLAAVSVMGPMKSSTVIATIAPLFVLALPIFDTAFAILRRKASGKPIMQADKGHLHHRMLNIGLGPTRTVLILYSLSAIMGIAAILIRKNLLLEACVLVCIDAVLIYVFMKERKK